MEFITLRGNEMYIEYLKARAGYEKALAHLRNMLDKREEIFLKSLPSGIRYDLEKISRSVTTNTLDLYVMNVEEVEEKIRAAKIQLFDRKEVLDIAEKDLRKSQALPDKIFVRKYIDHKKVTKIARELNYSQERIYQIDKNIRNDITNYYNSDVL